MGAGIPGLWPRLTEAVPVAQGHVVDVIQRQTVDRQHVGWSGHVFAIGLRAERASAAMGEHDPRPITVTREIELPDPRRGIARRLPLQERAGEDHGVVALHCRLFEQHVQVRGPRAMFGEKEGLLPQAAVAAMVVIARDHVDGHGDLADHAERMGDDRLGGRGGIEEVAGHQHEPRLPRHDRLTNPTDGLDPLLLHERAPGGVAHAREGLAQLPVGGVDERGHERMPASVAECIPAFSM